MSSSTAARADATGQPITFSYDGETYEVPAPALWDLDVLEAAEDGRVTVACRTLLGPAQWATFRSKPRNAKDLGNLYEAVQEAVGAGN